MSLVDDVSDHSAEAFLSSVYDDEAGHIREIDGHEITAVFCRRLSAVPTLRDFEIVKTGLPLSLSKDLGSASDNFIKVQFIAGQFRSSYSGSAPSPEDQAALDDMIQIYNLQPHDLGETKAEKEELDITQTSIQDDSETISEPDILDEEAKDDEAILEPEIINSLPPVIDNPADLTVTIFSGPDESESEEVQTETVVSETVTADVTSSDITALKTEPVDDVAAGTHRSEQAVAEATVPLQSEALNFNATCDLIASNGAGLTKKLPISAAALQNMLSASPVFSFPAPAGLALRGLKCERNSLTPAEHDYKVALAGYPFLYFVNDVSGATMRVAALEFVDGKYRMNLMKGDFTDQELIDAKARILSFNAQRMQENLIRTEGDEK